MASPPPTTAVATAATAGPATADTAVKTTAIVAALVAVRLISPVKLCLLGGPSSALVQPLEIVIETFLLGGLDCLVWSSVAMA